MRTMFLDENAKCPVYRPERASCNIFMYRFLMNVVLTTNIGFRIIKLLIMRDKTKVNFNSM